MCAVFRLTGALCSPAEALCNDHLYVYFYNLCVHAEQPEAKVRNISVYYIDCVFM
jgi:hypothetical protein